MIHPRYRALIVVAALAGLTLPAVGRGDVVRLKDGSTLKGRVMSLVGDTLTIRSSFGGDLRVPRSQIAVVSFTDSLPGAPPATGNANAAASGTGRIAVTFIDKDLSSKVIVERGRDRNERLRANWIEQLLVVDDVVVFTRIDSTMDKTVYNGPDRVYKNDVEMEDFEVSVPAGLHHCVLIVRNVGAGEDGAMFEGDPLDVSLALDNITVSAERSVRVKVGISRGRMRMGSPHLVRVE